jgi:hypothetical protein
VVTAIAGAPSRTGLSWEPTPPHEEWFAEHPEPPSRQALGSRGELTIALITRTQVIDATFTLIVDGGNFASWNPTIRSSRRLDTWEIGEGSRFEWDLRGFGKVQQELQEFDRPRQVRIVPHTKQIGGGHRFTRSSEGERTRIEHELEMRPKGLFVLFTPMMRMIGRKNYKDTANALQQHIGK